MPFPHQMQLRFGPVPRGKRRFSKTIGEGREVACHLWRQIRRWSPLIPSPDAGFGMKRNHQELPQEKS